MKTEFKHIVTYEFWDEYLEANRLNPSMKPLFWHRLFPIQEDRIVYFDCHSFHRGVKAIENGWRWFGRVTIDTNRIPTNELRKQVQVYLDKVNAGW